MKMRRTHIVLCCLLVGATVFAQGQPQFEVASIRPSSDQLNQVNVGLRVTGSQVRVTYMSVKDYVGIAYRVRPQQITGPDWIAEERFDISAKIPDGVAATHVPEMLQSLLTERFQLKVHRETKEFPVYVLAVAKEGLKLTEVAPGPSPADGSAAVSVVSGGGAGIGIDMGGGSSFNLANNRLEIKKMTMTALADLLTRFVDRPVVDQTMLKGSYDLSLDLTPEDYTVMMVCAAVNNGVALPPQAMRLLDGASSDQLSGPLKAVGLTFDARRAPLDVIVIDSLLKTPTDN